MVPSWWEPGSGVWETCTGLGTQQVLSKDSSPAGTPYNLLAQGARLRHRLTTARHPARQGAKAGTGGAQSAEERRDFSDGQGHSDPENEAKVWRSGGGTSR